MSDIKFVEPGWVDENWRHDGALQEMYVSLLGPEVWRNHRTLAAPTSLLLDLYAPADWEVLRDGVLATLTAVLDSDRFNRLNGLGAFIRDRVASMSAVHQQMFEQHGCLTSAHRAAFKQTLGAGFENGGSVTVQRLAAIMLTCMTADNDMWFVNHCAEQIWFQLCDVALTTPTLTPVPA